MGRASDSAEKRWALTRLNTAKGEIFTNLAFSGSLAIPRRVTRAQRPCHVTTDSDKLWFA